MKLITIILYIMLLCPVVSAQDIDVSRLADAIFKAEGGYRATWLYGIRSVKYKDEAEARQICINTIRNNIKRYNDYGYKTHSTYMEFLASRYCPVGCDNDRGTNKYWLKNVMRLYNKGE